MRTFLFSVMTFLIGLNSQAGVVCDIGDRGGPISMSFSFEVSGYNQGSISRLVKGRWFQFASDGWNCSVSPSSNLRNIYQVPITSNEYEGFTALSCTNVRFNHYASAPYSTQITSDIGAIVSTGKYYEFTISRTDTHPSNPFATVDLFEVPYGPEPYFDPRLKKPILKKAVCKIRFN